MRRSRATLLAAVLAALSLTACGDREAPRLLLIGIDGGSWNLIDPLLEAGELPHLAALRDRGVTAALASVEPALSPVVWTSLATGRRPEAHGVTTFFADRREIQVPTLWERFAAAGLKVGLYDYLVTWPPRHLPGGFVVPGWLRRDAAAWPPDLADRAGAPYRYEVVNNGGAGEIVANVERELEEKAASWNRLSAAMDPQVGALTFYALDVVAHRFYHTAFPREVGAPIATDPRFGGVIPRTVRALDRAVGELVAGLGAADHVVIVSDHGFRAMPEPARRWSWNADWLLARAGVDPGRAGVAVIGSWRLLRLRVEEGPEEERRRVLAALVDFFTSARTPAGGPLFRLEVVRSPQEAELEGRPPWMADTIRSQPPAFALLFVRPGQEALDHLQPEDVVEVAGEQLPMRRFAALHIFSGHHDPVGIFLAAGAAIRHRDERQELSILDVAPLLCYLAGQPIPDDLDGRLRVALIEPDYLRRHPPRRVSAAAAPRLADEGGDETGAQGGEGAAGDEEISRRLRALGYLQ